MYTFALFLCTSRSVYTSSRIVFLRYEFFHNTQSHPAQWSTGVYEIVQTTYSDNLCITPRKN